MPKKTDIITYEGINALVRKISHYGKLDLPLKRKYNISGKHSKNPNESIHAKWTYEQFKELKKMYTGKNSINVIAEKLGKTEKQVKDKIKNSKTKGLW